MRPVSPALFRLALLVALIVTTWAALNPAPPSLPHQSDKLAHALAFLTLALLADSAFPRQAFLLPKALPLLAYGLLLEILQATLTTRIGSLADALANGAGLLLYLPLRAPWRRLVGLSENRRNSLQLKSPI